MQDALTVGAACGDSAVGAQGQGPVPLVHGDQVVERAEQDQVVQAGGPAVGSGSQVMDLAPSAGLMIAIWW